MEHKLTVVEPAYVEVKKWYDADEEEIVSTDCIHHPANGDSSYECSCGEEFYNWNEAKEHIEPLPKS